MRAFDHRQAANARSDGDADALGVGRIGLKPCVADGFNTSRNTVMDEKIHTTRILGRNVLGDIKIADFASNLHREAGSIKTGNCIDT